MAEAGCRMAPPPVGAGAMLEFLLFAGLFVAAGLAGLLAEPAHLPSSPLVIPADLRKIEPTLSVRGSKGEDPVRALRSQCRAARDYLRERGGAGWEALDAACERADRARRGGDPAAERRLLQESATLAQAGLLAAFEADRAAERRRRFSPERVDWEKAADAVRVGLLREGIALHQRLLEGERRP